MIAQCPYHHHVYIPHSRLADAHPLSCNSGSSKAISEGFGPEIRTKVNSEKLPTIILAKTSFANLQVGSCNGQPSLRNPLTRASANREHDAIGFEIKFDCFCQPILPESFHGVSRRSR